MNFPYIQPMRLQAGDEAFDDEAYLFEPLWDGIRLQLHVSGGRAEAYARGGRIVTRAFPELQEAARQLQVADAVLDCEGVCLRQGRPVFDDVAYRARLQREDRIQQARQTRPATFIAFDVLAEGGRLLSGEPLFVRKERLNRLVPPSEVLAPTLHVQGQGSALSRLTREQGMEGIAAKRLDGLYVPGRLSPDWLKIQHWKSLDALILGYWAEPALTLIVGLHFRTVRSKPVGRVTEGLTPQDKEAFLRLAPAYHAVREGAVQWLEPGLCCRVGYRDRSDMHQLRPCRFQGFLPEKRPEDCLWPYDGES